LTSEASDRSEKRGFGTYGLKKSPRDIRKKRPLKKCDGVRTLVEVIVVAIELCSNDQVNVGAEQRLISGWTVGEGGLRPALSRAQEVKTRSPISLDR
jgi:hypothetical protein